MDVTRDVIVVGAGPGGSAAAYGLAKAGWSVALLDRSAFPRDKACGDGLTRRSVELLGRLDATAILQDQQQIGGVAVVLRGRRRTSMYQQRTRRPAAFGAVVPRRHLDAFLCRHAVSAGAELWTRVRASKLIIEHGRAQGVVAVGASGEKHQLRSRFVVAADGANSVLARGFGASRRAAGFRGFAIRQYFEGIRDLDAAFEFRVPLAEPGDERLIAGYGWVFPLPDGRANIGVGYFPAQQADAGLNVKRLFERFITSLRAEHAFREMVPDGSPRGAPLSCHVDFERCSFPGMVLVGDAAGLVDPFTGEGIDPALESGCLAAETIHRLLRQPSNEKTLLESYGRELARRYEKRFRAGRRFVRHHGFMWKVLVNTGETSGSLYDGLRAAVIDYGAPTRPGIDALPEVAPLFASDSSLVSDLKQAEARTEEFVGEQFPLLASLIGHLDDAPGRLLRPVLVMAAARCSGARRDARLRAASCIQLAYFGFRAHSEVVEDASDGVPVVRRRGDSTTKWSNLFAIMVGDCLGACAYRDATELGSQALAVLSAHSGRLSALRLRDRQCRSRDGHDHNSYLSTVVTQYATFLVAAVELGLALGNKAVPSTVRQLLVGFAQAIGVATKIKLDSAADCYGPDTHDSSLMEIADEHLEAARCFARSLGDPNLAALLATLIDVVATTAPSGELMGDNRE